MSDEVRWRRRPDVLWRRSLDAVVFLPNGVTEPQTLAGTGPEVWDLLAEPRTLDALASVLATAHAAEPATVRADVAPILEQLVELGAVEAIER